MWCIPGRYPHLLVSTSFAPFVPAPMPPKKKAASRTTASREGGDAKKKISSTKIAITFDWIARLVAFLSSLQVFAIGSVMAKFPFSLATTYRAIRMASLYVRGLITKDDFYDGHQNLRCLTS